MSRSMIAEARPDQERDRGAVLLLVLAVSIVLSLVVLALANFVAADLRYAQVVDAQAKRLASAESGIDYALDRLRLNQSLCATDVASSPVSLNGASSAGTPLPSLLNGTDTRVTCKRLDGAIADVAGWAVVIADPLTGPTARLWAENDVDPPIEDVTVPIDGPVFLNDPNRIHTESRAIIELGGGDLWYKGTPDCSPPTKRSSELPSGLVVGPATAHGPECTNRSWSEAFSAPLFPTLPTNLNPPSVVDSSGCLVFSPGHYTSMPDFNFSPNVYFQSGDYHLDYNADWTIINARVWVGHSGLAGSEELSNVPCENARNADAVNPPGATFYFDGTSQLSVKDGGEVEMFARQRGTYWVSAQALPGSTSTSSNPLIASIDFVTPIHLVIHGLVWAPDGWFTFSHNDPGSRQKLLGGIVVAGLRTESFDPPGFAIKPATSTADTRILLTSTSTLNGATTKVEAVVAYRPHAPDLEDRVAVNSFRVVD